jgi:endonuclease YncB( thermonuclease family)
MEQINDYGWIDRYKRMVGIVYLDGRDINLEADGYGRIGNT